MKAVIYLRISDEKQVLNTSLNTQEQVCRSYCTRQGYEVVDVVTDEAISAKKTNMQRVAELLDYCDSHKKDFDVLVVFKLDRFARSQEHHHYLRNKLLKKNIKLRSATEKIGEKGSEKLIEGILAAVNEYDNDIRIERTKLGMIRRLDEGLWPWIPPVGYFFPKDKNKKLVVAQFDQNCSLGIKEIFALYSSGVFTFRSIAQRINRLKLTNHRGTKLKFYPQQIEKILTNPFYVGLTFNTIDKKIRKGLHQALITKDTWDQCKQVKEGRQNKAIKKKVNDDFPLRGLVKGSCGHMYTAAFSRSKTGKHYGYYLCNYRDDGNHRSKILHDKFLDLLDGIEPEKEKVDLYFEIFLEEIFKRIELLTNSQSKAQSKSEEIEKKLVRLAEMRMEGEIDKDTYLILKNKCDADLKLFDPNEEEQELKETNWDEVARFGKSFVTNIRDRWEALEIQPKIQYQSLIFPEKLVWDGEDYRTPVLLEVLQDLNNPNFQNVTPEGIEPSLQG